MPKYRITILGMFLAFVHITHLYSQEYSRDLFPHWLTTECVDVRATTLASRSVGPVVWSEDGCRVVSGEWVDSYTGKTFYDASDVDIDHVVPLKEAFDSGAYNWPLTKRIEFANDPLNLRIVDKIQNRSKGSKDIKEYLPPDDKFICQYVLEYSGLKTKYRLNYDPDEYDRLNELLQSCSN